MIFIVALLIRAEIARQIQHTSDIMCIQRFIDSRSSTKDGGPRDFLSTVVLVQRQPLVGFFTLAGIIDTHPAINAASPGGA